MIVGYALPKRMITVHGEREKMRLIDADELSKNVCAWAKDEWNAELLPYWVEEDIEVMIESAPTVDAVEVVRCKDCKWGSLRSDKYEDYQCLETGDSTEPNGYCSWGERREDGRR